MSKQTSEQSFPAIARIIRSVCAVAVAAMSMTYGNLAVAETARSQDEGHRSGLVTVRASSGGSRIGLSIQDIESTGTGRMRDGAYVEGVNDESPAAVAGFEVGDIVTAFDGERVRGARQLARLVRETPVGRTVTATVERDGAPRTRPIRASSNAPIRVVPKDAESTTPWSRSA